MQLYPKLLDFTINLLGLCKDERAELSVLHNKAIQAGLTLPEDFEQWLLDTNFRLATFVGVTWVNRLRYVPIPTTMKDRNNQKLKGWVALNMVNSLVAGSYLYPTQELCQAKCDELHDAWYCDLLNNLLSASQEQRDKVVLLLSQLPAHELLGRLELVNYEQLLVINSSKKFQTLRLKREMIKLALYTSVPRKLVARATGYHLSPASVRHAKPSVLYGPSVWLRRR